MAPVRPFAIVVLAASLAATGCSSPSGGRGGAVTAPKAGVTSASVRPVATVSLQQRQIARIAMTGQPDWLAADARFLYVKEDSGDVVAIDPRTNRVAWQVSATDALCQGIGVGFGSVWTCAPSTKDDADDVVRIDPRTHRVVARLAVGKSPRQGHLVTGFGRVWVIRTIRGLSSLVGIDPVSDRADLPIPLGMLAVELAIDDNLVWAVSSVTGQVVGVDTRARKLVRRIDGLGRLGGPSVIAVGSGALLWVGGDTATVGIGRDSGRILVEVQQPTPHIGGFVATKTALWIHEDDPFLVRVDPVTGRPVEQTVAPDLPNGGDVLLAFGSLWASSNNQATLVRLRL